MGKACRVLEFAEGLLGLDTGREGEEDEPVLIGEGIGRGVADAGALTELAVGSATADRGAEGEREAVSRTGSATAGTAIRGALSVDMEATAIIAGGATPHPEAAGSAFVGIEVTGTNDTIGAQAGWDTEKTTSILE